MQDLASQVVTTAFSTFISGQARRVIDACAAPGGKSRLLRSLLPQATELISLDISEQRLQRLKQIATGPNWEIQAADFITYRGEPADAILIDAPCSSLGSVRRKPDTKYRSSRPQLVDYQSTQLALIDSAWQNLNPGGVACFVTCTPTVTETDRVIRRATQLGWLPIDTPQALHEVCRDLSISARPNGGAMLWGHRNRSDTMFMSLLRKPESK